MWWADWWVKLHPRALLSRVVKVWAKVSTEQEFTSARREEENSEGGGAGCASASASPCRGFFSLLRCFPSCCHNTVIITVVQVQVSIVRDYGQACIEHQQRLYGEKDNGHPQPGGRWACAHAAW
jgi:hypothetical protein